MRSPNPRTAVPFPVKSSLASTFDGRAVRANQQAISRYRDHRSFTIRHSRREQGSRHARGKAAPARENRPLPLSTMLSNATTTGTDTQLLSVFADILELAASEPDTMDEANERLWAIQDAAAQAVANELA